MRRHEPDIVSRIGGQVLDAVCAVLILGAIYFGARAVVNTLRPEPMAVGKYHPPARSWEEFRQR